MTAAQNAAWGGMWSTIGGAASQAIGAYFSMAVAKENAKSQAIQLELQESLSYINARSAEREAQNMLRAAHDEYAQTSLQYGQVKGSHRASTAARGIQGGVGSAGEVATSIEVSKGADLRTITRNGVSAYNQQMRASVNLRNRGTQAGARARGVRAVSSSMKPGLAAVGSLLGSSATVGEAYWKYEGTK